MKISVIITTYNRPDALQAVLEGLQTQDTGDFEVLIADDGSTEATRTMLQEITPKLRYPMTHFWQVDEGFQAAKIRNKAAAKAQGDYLIFLDGDCIPSPSFIRKHRILAEKGWFVAGNRILLNETLTQHILTQHLPVHTWGFWQWFSAWRKNTCNRLLPLVIFPLGPFRKIAPHAWQGVKTCNLGVWKEDYMVVNGFDESFVGWGYEDSEFISRLFKINVKRKEGRCAVPVFHLWHPENDRSRSEENYQYWITSQKSTRVCAERGVKQYISVRNILDA